MSSKITGLILKEMKRLVFAFSFCLLSLLLVSCRSKEVKDNVNGSSESIGANTPNFYAEIINKQYSTYNRNLDTLNRKVKYSEYKLFDDDIKGWPTSTFISVFEFSDTSVVCGYDFEYGKVILNTPDSFTIISLPRDSLSNKKTDLGALLHLFARQNDFEIAKCGINGIWRILRRSIWVSHFTKEYDTTGVTLHNSDGFDCKMKIDCKIDSLTAHDSIPLIMSRALPPFLFYTWDSYAKYFYRNYSEEDEPNGEYVRRIDSEMDSIRIHAPIEF